MRSFSSATSAAVGSTASTSITSSLFTDDISSEMLDLTELSFTMAFTKSDFFGAYLSAASKQVFFAILLKSDSHGPENLPLFAL